MTASQPAATPRLWIAQTSLGMSPTFPSGVSTFTVDATTTSITGPPIGPIPFLIEADLLGFSEDMTVAILSLDADGVIDPDGPSIVFEKADFLNGIDPQWRLVQDAQIELQADFPALLDPGGSGGPLEFVLLVERNDAPNAADVYFMTAMFPSAAPFASLMTPMSIDSSVGGLVTVTGGNFVVGDTEIEIVNTGPPFQTSGPFVMTVTSTTTGDITIPPGLPSGAYLVRAQLTSDPPTGTTTPVAIFTITPF